MYMSLEVDKIWSKHIKTQFRKKVSESIYFY